MVKPATTVGRSCWGSEWTSGVCNRGCAGFVLCGGCRMPGILINATLFLWRSSLPASRSADPARAVRGAPAALAPQLRRIVALASIIIAVACPAWSTVFHVKTDGSDSSDGLTWETARKTVQAGINADAPSPASPGRSQAISPGLARTRCALRCCPLGWRGRTCLRPCSP